MSRFFIPVLLLATLSGCTFSDALKPEPIKSTWSLPAPASPQVFFVTDREPDASALGFGPAAEEQKQATSPWALETPAAKPATAFHRVGTGSAPE